MAIDERYYIIVSEEGYPTKAEAYEVIDNYYSGISGITVYYDRGLWYIVRSKALM